MSRVSGLALKNLGVGDDGREEGDGEGVKLRGRFWLMAAPLRKGPLRHLQVASVFKYGCLPQRRMAVSNRLILP